jgi:uncharacterized protein (TIGR02118 family)
MRTAKMVVVYRPPESKQKFDAHYFGVHVPLAKKLPGLRRYEVSRGDIVPMNAATKPHLVAILHFDSIEALKAAFASEVGKACALDRKTLCPDSAVQTFLFDAEEI